MLSLSGGSVSGKVRFVRAGDGVIDATVEIGVCDIEISAARIAQDVYATIDSVLSEIQYDCEVRWPEKKGELLSKQMNVDASD